MIHNGDVLMLNDQVRAKIKHLREREGLTQKELAEKIGVVTSAVTHWERGTNRISLDMLEKVAQGLGVSIEEFFPHGYIHERKVSEIKRQQARLEKITREAAEISADLYQDIKNRDFLCLDMLRELERVAPDSDMLRIFRADLLVFGIQETRSEKEIKEREERLLKYTEELDKEVAEYYEKRDKNERE